MVRARDLGLADELPTDELPTVDDAVRQWLAATPATLAEAAGLSDRRLRAAADIRLARRLRDQIHAVQPCLPHLTSGAVAEELRAWIDLKPALLGPPAASNPARKAREPDNGDA